MRATDVEPDRFQAMQLAAEEFVEVLPERINLGLVAFAGTAATLVTPTTDRDEVLTAIDNLELAEATAIGDAIFTSLTAITNYQATLASEGMEAPPARIVLLSDGFRTSGRSMEDAGAAATAANVPVSTIAFGTDAGVVDIRGALQRVPVDRRALQELAERSEASMRALEAELAKQKRMTTVAIAVAAVAAVLALWAGLR